MNLIPRIGDITDAKFPSQMGSTQFIEEWAAYDAVLQQTGVLNVTRWLDMRGNHGLWSLKFEALILDNFNVPSTEHTDNYFRYFGVLNQRINLLDNSLPMGRISHNRT